MKTINEVFEKDLISLFIDRPACIKIEKTGDDIKVDYEGAFADVIGLSFDMINGLIESYKDSQLDIRFWYRSFHNFDAYLSFVNSLSDKIESKDGNISMFIDEKSYIQAVYNGNVDIYVRMVNEFINRFCNDYDISKEEYLESMQYAYERFEAEEDYKKMNINIIK